MSKQRTDGLDPKSYAARKKSGHPQISITLDRDTLAKLDRLADKHGGRGAAIAWLLSR